MLSMTYYGSTMVIHRRVHLLCSSFLLGFCKCSFSKSICTSTEHFFKMSHTSSARCLSSLSLGSPVETSSPCTGVTTRCTCFSGCGTTYDHIVHTRCATCCAVYQN